IFRLGRHWLIRAFFCRHAVSEQDALSWAASRRRSAEAFFAAGGDSPASDAMEIRQLEALNAIVTSGSVTAAGRMLGRSQPVVSRRISDLEAELGFLLFARTRPAITLTEEGAEFHQEVRGI